MPLSQKVLSTNIANAFKQFVQSKDKTNSSPQIGVSVAQALAQAYDNYVKAGQPLAGALIISVPPVPSGLASALVAPNFAGWAPGLITYWTPVIFAGPGFIPVNPTIPAALSGITSPLAAVLKANQTGKSSIDDSADQIASILHSFTIQVMVTTTTTSTPPVVAVVPIV